MTAKQEEMTQSMELKLPEMVNESAWRNWLASLFHCIAAVQKQTDKDNLFAVHTK